MSTFNQLKDLIASVEADAVKFFEKGNAAAGTRIRKAMQEAKPGAQSICNEVTAKNSTK